VLSAVLKSGWTISLCVVDEAPVFGFVGAFFQERFSAAAGAAS